MNPILAALKNRKPDDIVIQAAHQSLKANELLTEVEALRATLIHEGIDRSGLLAGNSAAWVIVDLACQAAEICLLPLPVFFSDTQLVHSMQTAGVDAVLTDDPQRFISLVGAQTVTAYPQLQCGLTLLRLHKRTDRPADSQADKKSNRQSRASLPSETRKITFTSGSTGAPRGVCLSAEQQLRVARALDTALQLKAPRHLCLLPLSTLLENIGGIYYPLLADGSIIVLPETETGFSGSTGLNVLSLLKAIDRHQPTSIILLPQMLVGLVAALEEGWQPPPALKFAAVGGAKVAAGQIRRARELGLPVYEGYGLSETASVACLNHPGNELIGSAGQPLSHVDVSVEAGEIFISGNTFLGYAGEPDSWGAQRVATGDLGEIDADGYVHLQGRRNNLLISSFGRNISPEWVESELLLYPEIEQCIVFGHDRPYVSALIVVTDPGIDDWAIQGLIDSVNETLPDYARIQRWHRLSAKLDHSGGLFTENGRPRRALIARYFAMTIESLYADKKRAVLQ